MKVQTATLERKVQKHAHTGVIALVLLSLGHFFVDLYSSALATLQPLLLDRFGLTLAEAGLLGGVLVFSSSVMQPVYGLLSDWLGTRFFAALGPAIAGIFISSLGHAPGFKTLVLMAFLGGAGIAAFHPQASAMAIAGLEGRRSRAMAVFVSAGTLGLAIGPTYFSFIAAIFGLARTHWAAVPGVITTGLLLYGLNRFVRVPKRTAAVFDFRGLKNVWRPLSILYMLVFLRSIVQITFTQFIPLYLLRERGYSLGSASLILSLYLLAGAIGGFMGGHVADRLGGRTVILYSMIGSVPFLALFFLAQGWLSVVGLLLGGFILLFTIPVNVVMAQELIPSQAGTISALMMGFAWGMAGLIFIPVTGALGDAYSLHVALAALVGFPVLGFLLSLKLPKKGAVAV